MYYCYMNSQLVEGLNSGGSVNGLEGSILDALRLGKGLLSHVRHPQKHKKDSQITDMLRHGEEFFLSWCRNDFGMNSKLVLLGFSFSLVFSFQICKTFRIG